MRPAPKQADDLVKEVQNDAENAPKISKNDEPAITKSKPSTEVMMFKKSQVEDGITTIVKLLEGGGGEGEKKNLFESEGEKISLQISGIKLPRVNDSQIIKIRLPHTPLPQSRDVCLIVKDLEKGIKSDHEATVQHFQSLLADKGIDKITQVISLRELKVEYKQFEAKTQLCHRFDLFLADARIIRLLPQFLGKPFYKRKKLPIQIDLNSKDLKAEVDKALMTSTLPLKHTGSCSSVSVGYSTLTKEQLVDNTLAVLKAVVEKFPGGWANVRSVYVKSQSTPSLPLYVTLRSSNDLGKVESSLPHVGKRKTVTDELSTVPGATVTVTPYGTVRVKRTADPDWDVDNEEPILEKEEKEEEEEKKLEKEKKKEKNVKKQKTEKGKPKEKEDDESEDEIENAELEYMKKVAEEEEEMEKSLVSKDKVEDKASKEESDHESEDEDVDDEESEEEDDVDDKEDAVNLLGEGEDDSDNEGDSDDELNLKDADQGSDSEPKPEGAPKQKKTHKIEKSKSERKKDRKENKSKEKAISKKSTKQKKFIEKKKKENLKSPKSKKK